MAENPKTMELDNLITSPEGEGGKPQAYLFEKYSFSENLLTG